MHCNRHFSESALLTDLYELSMLQVYHRRRMNGMAVFEFFVRRIPGRNFLLAAGLEQLLDYLAGLRFDEDDLAWMKGDPRFDHAFVDTLAGLRFTGDVDALPEGTVCFPDEPLVRITAPLREAQLVESRLINLVHFQTLVASKAARCVLAARGCSLIDFGMRRAHGAEAALLAARASYLAGFSGSATAIAAPAFDVPVFGTMAHSYIQAFGREADAFAAFVDAFPNGATLLIDTYDTEAAAHCVTRLVRWLRAQARPGIASVRIDSGVLEVTARRVRQILDEGECRDVGIFVSGNLDEYSVRNLLDCAIPVNGFGIGTQLTTAADAPFLDCAYKLVEYDGFPCRKRSVGKTCWPGRKQVFRLRDRHGLMTGDVVSSPAAAEGGEPLLRPVMRNGVRVDPSPSLHAVRAHATAQLASLPQALRALDIGPAYPVTISEVLHQLAVQVDARQRALAQDEPAQRPHGPG